MTYLPDVNFWLALVAERHAFGHVAREWFSNLPGGKLAFCRVSQMSFLRLLTNKHVMQDEVLSSAEAWHTYDSLQSNPRISFAIEPGTTQRTWRSFTLSFSTSPNIWTDAYLAAFAYSAQFTLVTFDSKMPVRNDVSCVVLSGGSA